MNNNLQNLIDYNKNLEDLLKVNYKRLSTVEKRKYSIKLKQEIKIAKKEKALENKSVNTLKNYQTLLKMKNQNKFLEKIDWKDLMMEFIKIKMKQFNKIRIMKQWMDKKKQNIHLYQEKF